MVNEELIKNTYQNFSIIGGHPGVHYIHRPDQYSVSEKIYSELMAEALLSGHNGINSLPKYALLGYRGTGKTTELNNLRQKIESIADSPLFPVELSVAHYCNMFDWDFYQIPFVLTCGLLDALNKLGIETVIDSERSKEITEWIVNKSEITEEKLKELSFEPSKVAVLGSVLKYLGFGWKYTRKVKKQDIEIIHRLAYDLVDVFNELVQSVHEKTGKHLIFLIDDADKLSPQAWDDIFRSYGKQLAHLGCAMVWCLPCGIIKLESYRVFNVEFALREILVDSIPLRDNNGKIIPANRHFFEDVVYSRIPVAILSRRRFLDICHYANGNLRFLLNFLSDCILHLVEDSKGIIDRDVITFVKQEKTALFFQSLDHETIERLSFIHQYGHLVSSEDDRLLGMDYVTRFRYRDSLWAVVHPAICECVDFEAFRKKHKKDKQLSLFES